MLPPHGVWLNETNSCDVHNSSHSTWRWFVVRLGAAQLHRDGSAKQRPPEGVQQSVGGNGDGRDGLPRMRQEGGRRYVVRLLPLYG